MPDAPADAPQASVGLPGVPAEELLRLDLQLCFSLSSASRAIGGVYRVVLKDLGLTYPQYLVMLVLWEHGPLSVKRIGTLLRLDTGTLSPLIKRLEAVGHVRRERSTHDERSVIVHLTDAGTALRDQALRVPPRILASTGLTPSEITDLQDLLNRVTAHMDATDFTGDCTG